MDNLENEILEYSKHHGMDKAFTSIDDLASHYLYYSPKEMIDYLENCMENEAIPYRFLRANECGHIIQACATYLHNGGYDVEGWSK